MGQKKNNMHKNIFFIGNGFDLDLGLRTKYSDFANSSFWPQQDGDIIPNLKTYLERKRDTESWFDIEGELLNYAQFNNNSRKGIRIGKQPASSSIDDIAYFRKIQVALCSYMQEQQSKSINNDSIAETVLKSVLSNGYFENIYSFNYTDVNILAKSLGVKSKIECIHIHGKVEDKSIILGVDETPLIPGYELFHKTMSPYYRSHNIFNDLSTSEEIVIFGLSFGSIDYTYFDRFFQSQSGREPIEDKKKKHITIFTKDENSRIGIMNRLGEMGINRQNLYTQSKFQIIRTAEEQDKALLNDFCERLSKNSKTNHDLQLRMMASMI
jgi:hypothetical protein